MRLRLVFRLILAFLFATLAAIYSQLIPSFIGDFFIIRVLLTLAAGGLGYMVFPSVARSVRVITMTSLTFVIHRLSSEVLNQIVKIPHSSNQPISGTLSQVGSVSMTRPLILDTSALIDGRILDIGRVDFINGLVLVPSFVLTELQQVADSADSLKRARGRRGFEVVEELKKLKSIRVEIWDKDQSNKAVDEKLLNLAKNLHGRIVTTDFNLNKLAVVSNISVLNVNDLANAVKTISLPGESMETRIVHLGKDRSQGVGYLADGTMVVVSGSAEKIGQTVKVEVTKNIQTPAGRMIFAKVV